MSAIRLAVQENRLSDPARITRQMYADYLDRLSRTWVDTLTRPAAGRAENRPEQTL